MRKDTPKYLIEQAYVGDTREETMKRLRSVRRRKVYIDKKKVYNKDIINNQTKL